MLEEPTSLRIDDPGVRALFTESARFQSWLDVEAALARAQAAGIAARFLDVDSYYVVSASALEERVDLFRIVNGKKERIWGTDADVVRDRWHLLELQANDDQFTISLDRNWLFTAWDSTLPGDGQVGLWTEEDNVTRFDRLEIETFPASEKRCCRIE